MKKIINYIVLKNIRTNGKLEKIILSLIYFLSIVLIGIISMIFILG